MIYIVSGSRRTGTSMMMRALFYGAPNISLVVNKLMEDANFGHGDYKANPNGLWEVGHMYYFDLLFTRDLPDNGLVKILYDGLPTLPAREYKVIFMERNEFEVRESIRQVEKYQEQAFIERGQDFNKIKALEEEITRMLPFFSLRPYDQSEIDDALAICKMRKDMDIMRVNYADVIDDPEGLFTRLRDWGIPIDPQKCANTIDKKLYRARRANCQQSEQGYVEPPLQLL